MKVRPSRFDGPRMRAYTTRKIPADLLERLRLLAAAKSVEDNQRCTLETMVTEAIRRGLPELEREIL